MNDIVLLQRLDELEKKIDATQRAAEKTRLYLLWTLVITVAAVLLPLVGLMIAIPSFLATYSSLLTL